ncbi:hypothetical protein DFH09DRAFT_1188665 [Mycena vulgaris]|nr:hypothetical protein DFH09DRAFT_1188665 [Mycena vulgaris]
MDCMYPHLIPNEDREAKTTDEALCQNSFTPVGQGAKTTYSRTMRAVAVLPITVVASAVPATAQPIPHYLTPGIPVPVLRRGPGAPADVPEFPLAHPVFTVEPLVDISARFNAVGLQRSEPEVYKDAAVISGPHQGLSRRGICGAALEEGRCGGTENLAVDWSC